MPKIGASGASATIIIGPTHLEKIKLVRATPKLRPKTPPGLIKAAQAALQTSILYNYPSRQSTSFTSSLTLNMTNIAPSPFGYGFVKLSPTTFYREPPKNVKSPGVSIAKEPYLILLASWMNADPRHVAKFTAGYQKIIPNISHSLGYNFHDKFLDSTHKSANK